MSRRMIKDAGNIVKKRKKVTDSFYNAGSGFGGSYDPVNRLTYNVESLLDRSTLELLYRQDWVTRKIVECIPDDSIRKGINLSFEKNTMVTDVNTKLRQLKAFKKFKEAMYSARLYGGGIIILGTKDGLGIDKPLDMDNIDDLIHLNVIDRWGLDVNKKYSNPLKPKYGEPESYKIQTLLNSSENINNSIIHETRVLRFDGSYLTDYLKNYNNGWHDSVLNQVNLTLKQYGSAIQSGAILFQDFISKVLKLPNLADLLTSSEGQRLLDLRIQYAIANLSSLGIVLIGEDEEYNKMQTPISGLSDLMNIYIELVSAASKIPRSRFFGQSIGTLAGATETTRNYYDDVVSYQNDYIYDNLYYLIKVILNCKEFSTKGKEPKNWDFKFNSLWDETNKDVTVARKMQSEVDVKYIENGVLLPEEIRESRFRPDGYSFDTHVGKIKINKPIIDPVKKDPIKEIEENSQDIENELLK